MDEGDSKNHKQQSKKIIIIHFVLSTIGILVGVAFVIILSLSNLTGVRAGTSFSLTNCTNSYYITKYSSISNQLQTNFFPVCLIIALEFVACFYSLYCLTKTLKITSSRQKFIYILVTLLIQSTSVSFGKCLTFYSDFKKMTSCSITFEQTTLTIALAFSSFLLLLTLTQLIIFMLTPSDIIQLLYVNQNSKEFHRKNQTEENVLQKNFQKEETLNNIRYSKLEPMRPDSFNHQLYARHYPQRQQITKDNTFQSKKYQATYNNDYARQDIYKQNNPRLAQPIDDLQKFETPNIQDKNAVQLFLSSKQNEQKQQFSNSGNKFMKYFQAMHTIDRQSEQNLEKRIKAKYGL